MAHIREQRGKWRAEVERLGVRKSRVFDTKDQAETWAAGFEPKLVERLTTQRAAASSVLISQFPRRVLDAMAQVEYSQREVARGALPAPMASGIYFLVNAGEIVYVGQSIDVLGRIARQRREGREFDAYNYILCSPAELDALEARYILAFMPTHNTSLGNRS